MNLDSINDRKSEFAGYKGEIGLDSAKGIFYGVIEKEDNNNIHLNPHLAYNAITLPDGKMLNNIEKRNSTRIIPKTLLTKLVQEYSNGYFDKFIEASNQRDEYLKLEFEKKSSSVLNYKKVEEEPRGHKFIERLKMSYDVLMNRIKY